MPELPEVETVRRTLERNYLNKTIFKVEVLYPKMIKTSLEELEEIFGKSYANWYYSQQIRGYGFYEDVSEFGSDRSISVWLNNNGNIEKISAMKIS
jgi:hypothetical protein